MHFNSAYVTDGRVRNYNKKNTIYLNESSKHGKDNNNCRGE
jgi:hypothetical protein